MSATHVRTHVITPVELVEKIDQRVGHRRRSQFLSELAARGRAEGRRGRDLRGDGANSFLQAFMRDEKKLTLGSIMIILQSTKETALRAYIQRLYPSAPTTIFDPDGLAPRLADPAHLDLRNAAAHDQALGRAEAQAARGWALGVLGCL